LNLGFFEVIFFRIVSMDFIKPFAVEAFWPQSTPIHMSQAGFRKITTLFKNKVLQNLKDIM
jgi:hypothetical protein